MTGWEWQEVWCAGWAVPCKPDFWFAEAEFRLGDFETSGEQALLNNCSTPSPHGCVPS